MVGMKGGRDNPQPHGGDPQALPDARHNVPCLPHPSAVVTLGSGLRLVLVWRLLVAVVEMAGLPCLTVGAHLSGHLEHRHTRDH